MGEKSKRKHHEATEAVQGAQEAKASSKKKQSKEQSLQSNRLKKMELNICIRRNRKPDLSWTNLDFVNIGISEKDRFMIKKQGKQ